MELKSPISSHFLHAGNDLALSPGQMPHPVPLLLTGNSSVKKTTGSCGAVEEASQPRIGWFTLRLLV
jgi:hypothetical protein